MSNSITLRALIMGQIEERLDENIEAYAQALATSATGKIPFSISGKATQTDKSLHVRLKFSYAQKYGSEGENSASLNDPNQPRLPLEEPSVTFRTGNVEATVSGEQLSEAVKRVSRKAKEAAV